MLSSIFHSSFACLAGAVQPSRFLEAALRDLVAFTAAAVFVVISFCTKRRYRAFFNTGQATHEPLISGMGLQVVLRQLQFIVGTIALLLLLCFTLFVSLDLSLIFPATCIATIRQPSFYLPIADQENVLSEAAELLFSAPLLP